MEIKKKVCGEEINGEEKEEGYRKRGKVGFICLCLCDFVDCDFFDCEIKFVTVQKKKLPP